MPLLKRYVLGKFVYSYLLSAAGVLGGFFGFGFFLRGGGVFFPAFFFSPGIELFFFTIPRPPEPP